MRGGAPAHMGLALACMSLCLAAAAVAGTSADRISVGPKGVVVERGGESDTVRVHVIEGKSERDGFGGHGGWIEVDDHGDALVRVFGDIHVPRGKRISDDVVAVFGSVEVEGQVDGDVVAVLGSVHVRDGAEVQGEVVSVGGVVD